MTYAHLLKHGRQYLQTSGKSPQQVNNLVSALRTWIDVLGFSENRVVAEEFSSRFDEHFDQFCSSIEQRLAMRTQRDRQEQILRWRRIAIALRVKDTLPSSFAEAVSHCLSVSPLTRRQIARDTGVTTNTLHLWSTGERKPIGQSLAFVPRLEQALEVPAGSLTSRLPLARRCRYERNRTAVDKETAFTQLRRSQLASLSLYSQRFSPRLALQWSDLLQLKTDAVREHARARNTWRLKPIAQVSQRVSPPMVFAGQICPTAGVHWAVWSSYLGWLKLPPPVGPGLPCDAVDTLAWLSSAQHVVQYARWQIRRAGNKFHNGVNVLLQLAESYLRPETGFVWLRPALLHTAPELGHSGAAGRPLIGTDEDWHSHCESARNDIRRFRTRAEDTMGIRRSRDPAERVSIVLQDDFPLRKLVEFVESLERSAPPPAHGRDYRAWLRDVALCRMMISNPLRVGQYAAMTFKADGTGNLVRVGPGRYRLRFKPEEFKNEKGAARMPYDSEVDDSVGPWLDRYLTEARPGMIYADQTARVFLPAVIGSRKEKAFLHEVGLVEDLGWTASGMLTRLKALTSAYIEGCPGFGPHAFRHVLATNHLRRHPGDYLTVSTLLHDKLETVLKNYSHLRVDDGLRALSAGIKEATQDLAARRQAIAPSQSTTHHGEAE